MSKSTQISSFIMRSRTLKEGDVLWDAQPGWEGRVVQVGKMDVTTGEQSAGSIEPCSY
jgi:hypothetical protein